MICTSFFLIANFYEKNLHLNHYECLVESSNTQFDGKNINFQTQGSIPYRNRM